MGFLTSFFGQSPRIDDILEQDADLTETERETLQQELDKVELDIVDLSQKLAAQEKRAALMKKRLGITKLDELKQGFEDAFSKENLAQAGENFKQGFEDAFSKENLAQAGENLEIMGQKTAEAFSKFGAAIKEKFEDVKEKMEEKMDALNSTSED